MPYYSNAPCTTYDMTSPCSLDCNHTCTPENYHRIASFPCVSYFLVTPTFCRQRNVYCQELGIDRHAAPWRQGDSKSVVHASLFFSIHESIGNRKRGGCMRYVVSKWFSTSTVLGPHHYRRRKTSPGVWCLYVKR